MESSPPPPASPASAPSPGGRGWPWSFYQGRTVIVTGASSGLGVEFARQLGGVASCLVLAARRLEPMQQLAEELTGARPALRVIPCACDLGTDEGREALWEKVDGMELRPAVLINNAGLGDYGEFIKSNERRIREQLQVNITALTLLTRSFVSRVTASAEAPAGILNVSSLASIVPMPDLSVYAATKAYVSSLSEALAIELAAHHIRVCHLCPGPTPTNFGKNARREDDRDIDRSGQDMLVVAPDRVVSLGLQGLAAGRKRVFPGRRVRFAAFVFQMMPSVLLRRILAMRYRRSQQKNLPPS